MKHSEDGIKLCNKRGGMMENIPKSLILKGIGLLDYLQQYHTQENLRQMKMKQNLIELLFCRLWLKPDSLIKLCFCSNN